MGVPFLLHEDHLDVSPTRSTFSFGSFSGLGEDRRGMEKGGWQTTILPKLDLWECAGSQIYFLIASEAASLQSRGPSRLKRKGPRFHLPAGVLQSRKKRLWDGSST